MRLKIIQIQKNRYQLEAYMRHKRFPDHIGRKLLDYFEYKQPQELLKEAQLFDIVGEKVGNTGRTSHVVNLSLFIPQKTFLKLLPPTTICVSHLFVFILCLLQERKIFIMTMRKHFPRSS